MRLDKAQLTNINRYDDESFPRENSFDLKRMIRDHQDVNYEKNVDDALGLCSNVILDAMKVQCL